MQRCNDVVPITENVDGVVIVALIGGHTVVGDGADFAAVLTPDAFDLEALLHAMR